MDIEDSLNLDIEQIGVFISIIDDDGTEQLRPQNVMAESCCVASAECRAYLNCLTILGQMSQ